MMCGEKYLFTGIVLMWEMKKLKYRKSLQILKEINRNLTQMSAFYSKLIHEVRKRGEKKCIFPLLLVNCKWNVFLIWISL